MGDWIMLRGRRRFVIGVRPGGLILERANPNEHLSPCVYYNVSAREKTTLKVVKSSTVRARARARRLHEAGYGAPWTTIVWNGDEPTYVHEQSKFPGVP